MADLSHLRGSDLQIGPTGDLAIATGATETQQRILRRLLTNAGDYIWQLAYGGGLPAMVGKTVDGQAIAAIVRAQCLAETAIAPTPEPVVTATATPDGTVTVSVQYTDATTGTAQLLSFPVGS